MGLRRCVLFGGGAVIALALFFPMNAEGRTLADAAIDGVVRTGAASFLSDAWGLTIFLSAHLLGLILAVRAASSHARLRAGLRAAMAAIVIVCWLGALLRAASTDLPARYVTAYALVIPILFVLARPWAKSRVEILAAATILWRVGDLLVNATPDPAWGTLVFVAGIATAAAVAASLREAVTPAP